MSLQIQVSCLIRFWQKLHSRAFFRTFGNLKKFSTGAYIGKHRPNGEENEEISKMSQVERGTFLYYTSLGKCLLHTNLK